MTRPCPSTEELLRWIDGHVPKQRANEIRQHTSVCASCEGRLDRVTDDSDLRSLLHLVAPMDAAAPASLRSFLPSGLADAASTAATAWTDRGGDRDASPPRRLGPYTLEQSIGEGAFSKVYSAWDESLKCSVAIKVLRSEMCSGRAVERFIREAQSLAGITSEHVVRVLRAPDRADESPYLVMELVDGPSLLSWSRDSLQNNGITGLSSRENIEQSTKFIRDAAVGLRDVHQAGLVHRDVKPSNILLNRACSIAKLADFGLAYDERQGTLTQTAELIGTPVYMSPEQAEGRSVDARTDVYSLGATLYHLLTGQPPFQGNPTIVLRQIVEREPIPPRSINSLIPKDLECICLKAMEKQERDRYSTSDELYQDLCRWLEGYPVKARPPSAPGRVKRWYQRNPALGLSLTTLFLALVLGVASTTWLWLTNVESTRRANSAAEDLRTNRVELRNTVSQFQSRLYSDEGLHWQLAPTFRRAMFQDFLRYLETFEAVSGEQAKSSELADSLQRDYLMIAETARLVSDFDIAESSAEKLLRKLEPADRIRDGESSFADYLRESRAAQVVFWCEYRKPNADPTRLQRLAKRAAQAITLADAAKAADTDQIALQRFRVRLLELISSPTSDSSLEDAVRLIEDIRGFPPQDDAEKLYTGRLNVLPTAIEAAWFVGEHFGDATALPVLQAAEKDILDLREVVRTRQKPLFLCDYYRAHTSARIAVILAASGDFAGATEAGKVALISYQRALDDSPHNFLWRHEAASMSACQGDWLVELGQAAAADGMYDTAVTRFVSILRNDPHDNAIRLDVIRMLTKKARLSARRDQHDQATREFYMAAQDFRHFLAAEELQEMHATYYAARNWLLANAVFHASHATNVELAKNIRTWETSYVANLRKSHPRTDTERHAQVLEKLPKSGPMVEFLELDYSDWFRTRE